MQAQEHKIRTQKLVGGPGFEPGASRSRTVRAAKLRQPPIACDSIGALIATPTADERGPVVDRTSFGSVAYLRWKEKPSPEAKPQAVLTVVHKDLTAA